MTRAIIRLVRIATINLLNDPWKRQERLKLFVAEVKRLKPDVILLQEVSLSARVPEHLAKALPEYHLSLCPRHGRLAGSEAEAVLSSQKTAR